MGEVIPAHRNKFWGPTESFLRRRENVATASMSAQIDDESSYITVFSYNGSYLTTRSSPFQAHTVDKVRNLIRNIYYYKFLFLI